MGTTDKKWNTKCDCSHKYAKHRSSYQVPINRAQSLVRGRIPAVLFLIIYSPLSVTPRARETSPGLGKTKQLHFYVNLIWFDLVQTIILPLVRHETNHQPSLAPRERESTMGLPICLPLHHPSNPLLFLDQPNQIRCQASQSTRTARQDVRILMTNHHPSKQPGAERGSRQTSIGANAITGTLWWINYLPQPTQNIHDDDDDDDEAIMRDTSSIITWVAEVPFCVGFSWN